MNSIIVKNLEIIDVSAFITRKATDLSYMFSGCSSLTELKLDSFDTSNVKNMNSMFNSCTGIHYLDLFTFNTTLCTKFDNIFDNIDNMTVRINPTLGQNLLNDLKNKDYNIDIKTI